MSGAAHTLICHQCGMVAKFPRDKAENDDVTIDRALRVFELHGFAVLPGRMVCPSCRARATERPVLRVV